METVDKPTPTQKQANKIFSYKPKGEQLTFLESLIAEKGSMTTALQHCVDQAMNPVKDIFSAKAESEMKKKIEGSQKVIDEYIEREKLLKGEIQHLQKNERIALSEISNLKSEISILKSPSNISIKVERTGIGML